MNPLFDSLSFVPEAALSAISRHPRDTDPAKSGVNNITKEGKSPKEPAGVPNATLLTSQTPRKTPAAGMTPTDSHTGNGTGGNGLTTNPSPVHTDGHDTSPVIPGTVAAVVITVVLIAVFIGVLVYLRRKGKLRQKSGACFKPIRKRRSSTSDSRKALEDELDPDKEVHHHDDQDGGGLGEKRREERDMFTIDDFEDPEDEASRGDEYFYDEVFGQSQFEDEATQNSVRQLYSRGEDEREEELLDFDFETLGIKIGDYQTDPPSRRNINF